MDLLICIIIITQSIRFIWKDKNLMFLSLHLPNNNRLALMQIVAIMSEIGDCSRWKRKCVSGMGL